MQSFPFDQGRRVAGTLSGRSAFMRSWTWAQLTLVSGTCGSLSKSTVMCHFRDFLVKFKATLSSCCLPTRITSGYVWCCSSAIHVPPRSSLFPTIPRGMGFSLPCSKSIQPPLVATLEVSQLVPPQQNCWTHRCKGDRSSPKLNKHWIPTALTWGSGVSY